MCLLKLIPSSSYFILKITCICSSDIPDIVIVVGINMLIQVTEHDILHPEQRKITCQPYLTSSINTVGLSSILPLSDPPFLLAVKKFFISIATLQSQPEVVNLSTAFGLNICHLSVTPTQINQSLCLPLSSTAFNVKI